MAHNEIYPSGVSHTCLGLEWNSSSTATYVTIAPTVWRWDEVNTNNSGGRFWEALYPEPDGSTGGWTGLAWGSGSGWRKIDTFATRKYNRTHSTQTIHLDVGTDASYGTYWYGWVNYGTKQVGWTLTIDPLASYSVTFNANGGSGAPSSQTKWYGESMTLSSTKPSRTNYVFKNWNTKSDGSGTAYSSGASYTGNAALALYAQWYAPYTITPNANGGTLKSGCSALTKVYNTAKAIWASSLNPTRTGYTFTGWNTKSDGTGTSYAAGANYTANANATLYAQWKINTWTVSYNGNGSTGGSTSSQTKTYNQALTLRSNGFTRTNYNFVNWNTAANGSGTGYSAGGTLPANVNNALTLYAQWAIAHSSPTIQSITVKRCDDDGTDNVEGTRMHVVAAWKVDNTTDGFTDTTGSTFKVTLNGTTDTVNLSGTSGTVDFVHSATAAIGSSYNVTSVLADSKGYSTTRMSVLSVAFFTMHFKEGGTGVGIGAVAVNDNELEVGMPLRLYANAATNNAFIRFKSAYRSADAIRFYGATDANGDAVVIGDAGMTVIGSGESPTAWYNRIIGTDDEYIKNFTPGTENMFVTSDSVVVLVSNANTIENRKLVRMNNDGNLQTIETQVDTTKSNNNVSAASYRNFGFLDGTNHLYGYLQGTIEANGSTSVQLRARNQVNGSNVDNGVSMAVAADGTRSVGFSDAAVWRNALFGNFTSVSGSTVSVATSTKTNLCSISLTAGLWVVVVWGYAAGNSTGARVFGFTSSTAANWSYGRGSTTEHAAAGTVYTADTFLIGPTATTTYYVHGWQNSGSALNMSAYVRAFQLK